MSADSERIGKYSNESQLSERTSLCTKAKSRSGNALLVMSAKPIVVIGTSSGGIEALRTLMSSLPADFPAPICVVMHTSPQSPGILHEILGRAGKLPVYRAEPGMPIRRSAVYVAPPDRHLLVERGSLRVTRGPRENRFRPAIDPLFRSAARVYGQAVIGVVLTGDLDDGTAGLSTIKHQGGIAIAQDPADALYPSMPTSVIRHVPVDHVVPIAALGALLVDLTARPVSSTAPVPVPASLEIEVNISNETNALDAGVMKLGDASPYACPECHGVLLEIKGSGVMRFRCHTGHAYSVASLAAALGERNEEDLWNVVRSLEESAMLMERLAQHMREDHDGQDADLWLARSKETKDRVEQIRNLTRNDLRGTAADS